MRFKAGLVALSLFVVSSSAVAVPFSGTDSGDVVSSETENYIQVQPKNGEEIFVSIAKNNAFDFSNSSLVVRDMPDGSGEGYDVISRYSIPSNKDGVEIPNPGQEVLIGIDTAGEEYIQFSSIPFPQNFPRFGISNIEKVLVSGGKTAIRPELSTNYTYDTVSENELFNHIKAKSDLEIKYFKVNPALDGASVDIFADRQNNIDYVIDNRFSPSNLDITRSGLSVNSKGYIKLDNPIEMNNGTSLTVLLDTSKSAQIDMSPVDSDSISSSPFLEIGGLERSDGTTASAEEIGVVASAQENGKLTGIKGLSFYNPDNITKVIERTIQESINIYNSLESDLGLAISGIENGILSSGTLSSESRNFSADIRDFNIDKLGYLDLNVSYNGTAEEKAYLEVSQGNSSYRENLEEGLNSISASSFPALSEINGSAEFRIERNSDSGNVSEFELESLKTVGTLQEPLLASGGVFESGKSVVEFLLRNPVIFLLIFLALFIGGLIT